MLEREPVAPPEKVIVLEYVATRIGRELRLRRTRVGEVGILTEKRELRGERVASVYLVRRLRGEIVKFEVRVLARSVAPFVVEVDDRAESAERAAETAVLMAITFVWIESK